MANESARTSDAFLHIGETDFVAGVIGLELRNPLGSKSARFAGGFPVDLAETAQQRRFAFKCWVEDMQPRQGFPLALPHGGRSTPVEVIRLSGPSGLAAVSAVRAAAKRIGSPHKTGHRAREGVRDGKVS